MLAAEADGLLTTLASSIHAEAGTLAEALWRYGFCRSR